MHGISHVLSAQNPLIESMLYVGEQLFVCVNVWMCVCVVSIQLEHQIVCCGIEQQQKVPAMFLLMLNRVAELGGICSIGSVV